MAEKDKGWFLEQQRHRAAAKFGRAGEPYKSRKKTVKRKSEGITINIAQKVAQTPLKETLTPPVEQERFEEEVAAQAVPQPEQKVSIAETPALFTSFFGGLGEDLISGAGKKGEEIGGAIGTKLTSRPEPQPSLGYSIFPTDDNYGKSVGGAIDLFTGFFFGLGEEEIAGAKEAGEIVGTKIGKAPFQFGAGVKSAIFPDDESAKKTISGEEEMGKQNEMLSIMGEEFGGDSLDKKFDDMAKTKVDMMYVDKFVPPEDEEEIERFKQEEREREGLPPTGYGEGREIAREVGQAVGKEAVKVGRFAEKEAVAGARYAGKEAVAGAKFLGKEGKKGLEWLEEKLGKKKPEPTEEEMAEQVAAQPEPAPEPQIPQGRAISEAEAQQIVSDLEKQKAFKKGKKK